MKSDKKEYELDTLLKSCLHTEQDPGDILHQKVMKKWKEQSNMKKKKSYKTAVAAAAVVLASTLSVGAAIRFFTPKEVAQELGNPEIAELFETDDAVFINETQEGTQYAFTLLGLTEGSNLLQLDENDSLIEKDSFYAVVAISNKDGSDLSMEDFYNSADGYFISPLIQGLEPWMYNIASMNGGYTEAEMDGIVYRMINCDKIGYFSDRNLYLCISDTSFYETEAYQYDADTGTVTPNIDYEGTNLLFDLPIESGRADAELAEKYLQELENEWGAEPEEDMENDFGIDNPSALADYTMYLEALNNTPEELDAVLANMGMTKTSQQTAASENEGFHFSQELGDGDSNDIVFYMDSFNDGLAESCQYSESDEDASLVLIVARLNEDGTATCTFYKKTYPNE